MNENDIKNKQNELEFEKTENTSSPLGKVDVTKTNRNITNVSKEELNEKVNLSLGKMDLPLHRLPTKGIFYPNDFKIFIRAAKTAEIKDFSLMDETNALDINDKINSILSLCAEVRGSSHLYSFKDIVEDDKMFIVLSIRELTFPKGESVIKLKPLCPQCDFENDFDLRTDNLQYYEENKKLQEYYNAAERKYDVKTKDYGIITLTPPKIGVMQAITDYAKTKQLNRQKWDKAAVQLLPYMNLDWKGLNEKVIMEKLISFQSWDVNKYTLVFRLIELMKAGIKQSLQYACGNCGHLMDVNVEIEGGMKSLFIPNDPFNQLV